MTTIYEAGDHLLIRAGYADPIRHRHMAAQIILSMDGAIRAEVGDQTFLCHGIVIPSGVSHQISTGNSPVLVFLYDSTTAVSAQIHALRSIPEDVCSEIITLYHALSGNCLNYRQFHREFLRRIGIGDTPCRTADSRILDAISYINDRLPEPVTCREAADAVCLSESRFSHLFRQETGMTFASYLIYQRLMYVYAQRFLGKSLTEAAIEAGFSGSSHFADVNRRVFGLTASQITRDWEFRKII